jgi:hypothetical protein
MLKILVKIHVRSENTVSEKSDPNPLKTIPYQQRCLAVEKNFPRKTHILKLNFTS